MNYRYFIPTAMLVASLACVSSAHADQAVGWYFGKWNCTWGKSITTINITPGGDGVAIGRVKDGQLPQVNLRSTSANASAITLQGDGNSIITMRLAPGSNPKRTEGTGTIDGLAEPLLCARHPATPQSISLQIFRFDKNDVAKGFQPIPGRLVAITSDGSGNTWGVNNLDEIYKYNSNTAQFERRPGLLRQIFAGGGSVWGVNHLNSVYRYSSASQSFEPIPGKLIHMVVGDNDVAWVLNGAWAIYRFDKNTQQFENIPGALRQLAGRSESNLWGLNHLGNVYHYNQSKKEFEQVPGNLKQIAADTSGNAWGINGKNEIYTYTLTSGRFAQMPGQLVQISVDSGGAVWGLNQNNNIYRFNTTISLFERVEGVLTKIEAGNDSVWGLK